MICNASQLLARLSLLRVCFAACRSCSSTFRCYACNLMCLVCVWTMCLLYGLYVWCVWVWCVDYVFGVCVEGTLCLVYGCVVFCVWWGRCVMLCLVCVDDVFGLCVDVVFGLCVDVVFGLCVDVVCGCGFGVCVCVCVCLASVCVGCSGRALSKSVFVHSLSVFVIASDSQASFSGSVTPSAFLLYVRTAHTHILAHTHTPCTHTHTLHIATVCIRTETGWRSKLF